MRGWLKATLVIAALAITILAATILLGQYAPQGLGSSLAQSLSIAVLALGITSSTIAVLSGRGIEEYFKRKNEEKRIKSALLSYFAGLPFQLLRIESVFHGISEKPMPPLPREHPPIVDSYFQAQTETIIRSPTIDTSFYEQNIRDHLLYLPEQLARQAVAAAMIVTNLNDYYSVLLRDVSGKSPILQGVFPAAYVLTAYMNSRQKAHRLISELASEARTLVLKMTNELLEGKVFTVDFSQVLEKMRSIKDPLDKAQEEFMKTLFPQANAQPSPSDSDKPRPAGS